jgi:hypothetical protein
VWSSLSFDGQLLFLRGAVLFVLYLFVAFALLVVMGDLRRAARKPRSAARYSALGYLVLVEAGPTGLDPKTVFPLEAVSPIGRSLRNTVSLDDEFLSAEHALLSWREGSWWLEDLGSTNGTFLNGVRVSRILPLASGDLIELGRVALRLEC